MRVKSEIWVQAYMRRCMGEGLAAYVAKSGDPFAGAIFIRIDDLAGGNWLFGPAPAGLDATSNERRWTPCFKETPVPGEEVEAYLQQQKRYDPDLWIIEIEDKQARHFLAEELVSIDD